MIAIVNYEIGNIGSLRNVFHYLGESVEIASDPSSLENYSGLILPGVGAFDSAMSSLTEKGFVTPLKNYVSTGKPILGICLGMQILCKRSEEGKLAGLGLLDGEITSLTNLGCSGKVPHVGFNEIKPQGSGNNFFLPSAGKDFYFVHSFALGSFSSNDDTDLAMTEYSGASFISAIHSKNIFATQFHPEKSGESGIQLLSEFVRCSKNA